MVLLFCFARCSEEIQSVFLPAGRSAIPAAFSCGSGRRNYATCTKPKKVRCYFKMTLRNFLKIVMGLLLLFAAAIGLTSINHPIILKWLSGSARRIGKPITATVYTNGKVNSGIKVFHVDEYWGSSKKVNSYLLSLTAYDSLGMLKFFNINLNEKWIGSPVGTSKNDYDCIAGHLFQSETGGHFISFQDDMKGFNFDPQLLVTERQIRFNIPPNKLNFDSVRIELQ